MEYIKVSDKEADKAVINYYINWLEVTKSEHLFLNVPKENISLLKKFLTENHFKFEEENLPKGEICRLKIYKNSGNEYWG